MNAVSRVPVLPAPAKLPRLKESDRHAAGQLALQPDNLSGAGSLVRQFEGNEITNVHDVESNRPPAVSWLLFR